MRCTQSRIIVSLFVLASAAGCGDDAPPTAPAPPAPLRLSSIAPAFGPTTVSTSITIAGTGFTTDMTLTIGGAQVPVQLLNSGVARGTAPPHASGTVDVAVTRPDGQRSELPGGFRYVDIPVALAISGTTTLQTEGETTQLTATATYGDGRTADVTRDSVWSADGLVATVDQTGLVTARGLGVGSVSVRHPTSGPSRSVSAKLVVTPACTFAMTGRVREPGAGGLSGARVLHVESGQSAISASDGLVRLGGLIGAPRLRISRDGYEDGEATGEVNGNFDAPLHRIVRLAAGAPAYTSQLAPNDVDLDVGGGARCQPCRVIRITSSSPGPAEVTLGWGTGIVPLRIWIDGQVFGPSAGSSEVKAGITLGSGETRIIVGRPEATPPSNYIPFSVTVRQ